MPIDFTQVKSTVKEDFELQCINSRKWRDTELSRADIMLNRVQDGETGIGTQKAWGAYRVELRGWPDTASFPDTAPVAPDAK